MAHVKHVSLEVYNGSQPGTMQVPDTAAATCQTYYYRPKITKEECELLLRGQAVGTFIARDSSTFVGGFCIMMRLVEAGSTVTRSYLLEKVSSGIHLRLTDEKVFPTLYDFIHSHTLDKMVLPSRLTLPTSDWLAMVDPGLATKTIVLAAGATDYYSPVADTMQAPPVPPKPMEEKHSLSKNVSTLPAVPPLPPKSSSGRSSPLPDLTPSPEPLPPRPPKGGPIDNAPARPPKLGDLPPRPPKNDSPVPPRPSKVADSADTTSPRPAKTPEKENSPRPLTKSEPSSLEIDEVECELYYFGCMDTWADSHVECIFQTYLELVEIRAVVPNKVNFKMAGQSITIEDKGSKQFIRRHYPIRSILLFDLDPDQRTCKVKKEKKPLSVFGMVIRKPGQDKNLCHLFATQHVAASGVIDAVQSALELICGNM